MATVAHVPRADRGLGVYAFKFLKSLAMMVMNLPSLTENDILLQVLV
jgi:uncharacterized membrane protein YqhA